METDFTKPVSKNRDDYKDVQDCFGQEFDITNIDCASCHDNEICSIFYKDNVIADKIRIIEEKVPEIFDKVDFDSIDKKALEKLLLEKSDAKQPIVTSALVTYIGDKAKTKDTQAIVTWLKDFIVESGDIKTENGVILRKHND